MQKSLNMKFPNKFFLILQLFIPLYGAGVRFRVLLRLREFCRKHKLLFLGSCIKSYLHKRYGCEISIHAIVSPRAEFMHTTGVIIGEGVTISGGVKIYGNVNLGRKNVFDTNDYPFIDENVVLGNGCSVLGRVHIGKNSVIGAHSVVLVNVEDNATYAGIPVCRIK